MEKIRDMILDDLDTKNEYELYLRLSKLSADELNWVLFLFDSIGQVNIKLDNMGY